MAFLDFVHSLIKDRPGVKPIICAHNLIAFDLVVMKYNFEQCGLRWPEEWMFLDSVLLARMSGSKRNKLVSLRFRQQDDNLSKSGFEAQHLVAAHSL